MKFRPFAFDTPRAALLRRRGGWPMLAAAACFAGAGWLHVVSMPAQRAALRAARADVDRAVERAEARRPRQPTEAASPLLRFQGLFPTAAQRHVRLAALVALARVDGVETARVESRWLPGRPLARYEITMPVRGDYERVRAFIADALQEDAALSLDGMRLQRTSVDTASIDGELRWSLHLRNDDADGPTATAAAAP